MAANMIPVLNAEPCLDGLPEELLLSIAKYIREGHGQKDASSSNSEILPFCLISRKFRRIGEEALYTSPLLRAGSDSIGHCIDPASGDRTWDHYRIAEFLRAITRRPELASFIKSLDLQVWNQCTTHNYECLTSYQWAKGECGCGWKEAYMSIKDFIRDKNFINSPWKRLIKSGYRPVLVGLIMAVAPNLQDINIKSYNGVGTTGQGRYQTQPLLLDDWFGTPPKAFDSTKIPGLSSLTSFTTDSLIPWPIFCLSNISSVHFAMQNKQYGNIPASIALFDDGLQSRIETLTIDVDVSFIDSSNTSFHRYLENLIQRLPKLKTLSIRLTSCEPHWEHGWEHDGSYDRLTRYIKSGSVETLIIDTMRAEVQCLIGVRCMMSLAHLQQLHRIIAPQEAFFEVSKSFMQCKLPASLRSLELIDGTQVLERYLVEGILRKQDELPNLTEVINWAEANDEEWADEIDERLREGEDSNDDDDDIERSEGDETKKNWRECFRSALYQDGTLDQLLGGAGIAFSSQNGERGRRWQHI